MTSLILLNVSEKNRSSSPGPPTTSTTPIMVYFEVQFYAFKKSPIRPVTMEGQKFEIPEDLSQTLPGRLVAYGPNVEEI